MGVIASYSGNGGCLAHVEARGTEHEYAQSVGLAVHSMLEWLQPMIVPGEPLGVALFGNSGGKPGDFVNTFVNGQIETVTKSPPAPLFDFRGTRPYIGGAFYSPEANQVTVCYMGCSPGPALTPAASTVVVQDQHDFVVTNSSDHLLV